MRNSEVMNPFRAPRKCVENQTRSEQVSMRRQQVDSEEATQFGLVRSSWIVPETEEESLQTSQDNSHRAVPENKHVPELQCLNCGSASPILSEFEEYLNGLPSKGASTMASTLPLAKPAHLSKDEWWDSVLQAEKERLQQLEAAQLVPVDEIYPSEAASSDDDIPIVLTLPGSTSKARKKKKVQTLWSYETVNEPTGVHSKYWDSPAPMQRATKQQAKQKLDELKNAEKQRVGASFIQHFF